MRKGFLLAFLPALAVAACGQPSGAKPADQTKTAIIVAETPAEVGTIASILSYSGSVTPRWTINWRRPRPTWARPRPN